MFGDIPAQSVKEGLLPTPALPEDLNRVDLTDNARQVLTRRYVRHGRSGEPIETVEEMFWRVAYHIARVEEAWLPDTTQRTREFYQLLTTKCFFPNSPTFTGAGTPLGQLAACFVLPIADDMGRHPAGIFQSLRDAALIQQTGGGNGFSFSRLRPKNTLVKSSAGRATGPVGFLRVYDKAFGEIAQGGTRRGANMAVLRVDHPDIEDFITCKTDENAITNFNISVGVTDAFMEAVMRNEPWDLRFPDVSARNITTSTARWSRQKRPASRSRSIKLSLPGNYSTRSSTRRTTMASPACSSWMLPTVPTLCRSSTSLKRRTRAESSGWAHTRTAAWALSTWRNTSDRGVASIGRSFAGVSSFQPSSWTMLSKPMPTFRLSRSSPLLPTRRAASAWGLWAWAT